MENAFIFILKNIFVLNFCLSLFGDVGKRLDKKPKIFFKIYENTIWGNKQLQ